VVAAVLVGLWTVGLTTLIEFVGWAVEQVLIVSGLPTPGWIWLMAVWLNAALVAIPAALLATIPRSATIRATGWAWLSGAAALGLLGPVRAVPAAQHELYLGLLAVAAAALAVLVRSLRRRSAQAGRSGLDSQPTPGPPDPGTQPTPDQPGPDPRPVTDRPSAEPDPNVDTPDDATDSPRAPLAHAGAIGFAVAAGLGSLLPWLWFGALGGALETALAVLAALAVGWLAGAILNEGFWSRFATAGKARLILLGGLVAGVTLVEIAASTGASGEHLPELLVLPPLGFVAATIYPLARRIAYRTAAYASVGSDELSSAWPIRCLIALAALGPLAFVDNEEVTLLLAGEGPPYFGRDVPFWTAVAAASSLAIGLLFALAYGFALVRGVRGDAFRRVRGFRPLYLRRWVSATTAGALTLIAVTVYIGLGHPGLYGEKLFVVLRSQADLSGIAALGTGQAARDQRTRATYQRLVSQAESSQAPLRHELDRLHLSYKPYYLVNAIEVDGGGPVVRAWLSRRSDVDRVLLAQQLRPVPAGPVAIHGSDPAPTSPQWNITMLGADRVWSQLGVTGSGIVVGTSDSGVDGSHPALAAGFRGGDDSWYDPWEHTRTPTDHNGHGTHTLATAVGRTDTGVAPGAQWAGCVNLDRNLGNPAHYLDCLQFMLAPFPPGGDPFRDGRPERAPQVLTNSWGCPTIEGCDEQALRPATAALAAAGIYFVAAAGNTGPFCGSVDDAPAPYPDVLTVGAVDNNRQVTDFSSRGPTPSGAVKPDVVAPGAQVLSALPGGGYARLDGTSMATPHVAGVVALMWSANPALIGDLTRTRQILRDTATPAEPSYLSKNAQDQCGQVANVTGAGVVNAFAAVQAAKAAGATR
jgi:subtilisin family serine protease